MPAPLAPTLAAFPLPLDAYTAMPDSASLTEILSARLDQFPFNGVATAIFLLAVLHTFFAKQFLVLAHRVQQRANARYAAEGLEQRQSVVAGLLHFMGEVEVVFGLLSLIHI